MFYQLYEMNLAAMTPMRAAADATRLYFNSPLNPLSGTPLGRSVTAGCEVFERATRRYAKPAFGLSSTSVRGVRVEVKEEVVWSRPFCNLLHFERKLPDPAQRDPKLLIVAPMSGHYATLLRGTVEAMLPRHDVYITDWVDARQVPVAAGRFDLDDYIDYVVAMIHHLGPDTHVVAVCQPAVPVFAAVALMEEAGDPLAPSSMTLMGGPIDTRVNPTAVNALAEERGLDWFRRNTIMTVPWPLPGFMRQVYPGFLQLGGFMSMNLDRHILAHREFYDHLVQGDGDSAGKHREFYDEYLAVMDLTAEFYLQTVDTVFVRHALPKGEMTHRGRRVDPSAIRRTALLTVEGERDDISGVGQTEAAQRLAANLPDDKRYHYVQAGVGHYGVFNGSRFRSEIAPRISDFVWTHDRRPRPKAARPAAGKPAAAPVAAPASDDAPNGQAPAAPAPRKAEAAAATKPRRARAQGLSEIVLPKPVGAADDLTRIRGIGAKLAETLNGLGIFHFSQLSALSAKAADELDAKLSFRGRVQRDDWIGQAKALAGAAAGS